MNSKNFFLMAMIICMVIYAPIRINQAAIKESNSTSAQYDEILADASSDAARQLIYAADDYSNENIAESNKVDYRNINLNLDKGLDRFYRTLYLNLNIENDFLGQQSIKYKIPIKLVTGYDGYYMSYFKADGKGEQWSEKTPYSMVDDKNRIIIHFTLDDFVYVTDLITKVTSEGKRKEFEIKYPNSCLKNSKKFNEVKGQVINTMIQEDLKYYTYHSNDIAKRNNWTINYDIPYWENRAVNSVAFMAFYQGNAIIGADRIYNPFGFGSTKTVRGKETYGYEKNGKKMYSNIIDGINLIYFPNEIEAAKEGYSPDMEFYTKWKK